MTVFYAVAGLEELATLYITGVSFLERKYGGYRGEVFLFNLDKIC